jgi:nucleoside-diphosphate-sugar epimerase
LNYYIESKIIAEKMIKDGFDDINWTILRPRGLFGIGDTSIIPRLIHANSKIGIPLFGGGENYVDMTCVENVALAVRLALESNKSNHRIYNITNDEPQEFKGLLEELFSALGETPRYRSISLKLALTAASAIEAVYKVFHIYKEPAITKYTICTLGYSQTLNITKAKKDLGYKQKITLSEGIKKYAKSYKKR